MSQLQKKELEQQTSVYDLLYPGIEEKSKNPTTFLNFVKALTPFFDKNQSVLTSNIVGKQLLFNKELEDTMLSVLGLNHKTVLAAFKQSEYLKQFSGMMLLQQFIYAIPMILLSAAYLRQQKSPNDKYYEQAVYVYLSTFFKPYASKVSRYFIHGVDDNRMLYVVETKLTEKQYIKKYGTLMSALKETAENSLQNYTVELSNPITDKNLQIIFQAGIFSRINNFIKNIAQVYYETKDGYMGFDKSQVTVSDDDGEDVIAANNTSLASIKFKIATKAANKFNAEPIDSELLAIAARKGFGRNSLNDQISLKHAITEVSEEMSSEIPLFFESILSSFLTNINPTTEAPFKVQDLKTLVFVDGALNLFNHTNTHDENILTVKKIFYKMLEEHSKEYIMYKKQARAMMKNALYLYFIFFIKKCV